MTIVEAGDLIRNFALVLLAAAGLWFAARQFSRARRRDDFDLFAKASEQIASENADLQFCGYLLMLRLDDSPIVGDLARAALADYIRTADAEAIRRIESVGERR